MVKQADRPRLVHQLVPILRNGLIDLRYGNLLSLRYLREPANGNSDYLALRRMCFGPVDNDDVLVDVGCGGGRVINHWLSLGYTNPLVGLELDPEVARRASARLRRFPNVEIISGDAIANLPRKGTIYYLFNPFPAPDVQRLEAALREQTCRRADRPLVIYHNPKHLETFQNDTWTVELDPGHDTDFHAVAYIRPAAHMDAS